MKILVIGAKGAYGKWLCQILESRPKKHLTEYEVKGIDKEETANILDFRKLIHDSDVIISAVSLVSSSCILESVCENAKKKSLIIDFSSSKKEIWKKLKECKSDFLMLHPMCAPPNGSDKISEKNRVYAIDQYRLDERRNGLFYVELKEMMGGDFIGISIEDHDIIDEMQAISHSLLLGFASFLIAATENSSMDYEALKRHSTPVSKFLFTSLERFSKKGNPDTSAKLIELAIKSRSKPYLSAVKFVSSNQFIGVPRFVEKLSKWITRIKRRLFGS
ncbi:MAG: hypothetical protein ACOCUT_02600 [bacterium]